MIQPLIPDEEDEPESWYDDEKFKFFAGGIMFMCFVLFVFSECKKRERLFLNQGEHQENQTSSIFGGSYGSYKRAITTITQSPRRKLASPKRRSFNFFFRKGSPSEGKKALEKCVLKKPIWFPKGKNSPQVQKSNTIVPQETVKFVKDSPNMKMKKCQQPQAKGSGHFYESVTSSLRNARDLVFKFTNPPSKEPIVLKRHPKLAQTVTRVNGTRNSPTTITSSITTTTLATDTSRTTSSQESP